MLSPQEKSRSPRYHLTCPCETICQMAQKYIPRKPGTRPMKPQKDRSGRLKLNPPRKQFLDPEVEQLGDERARLAKHGVRPAMERPRPQVNPRTEGWTQQTDTEGRPLLQFKQPRVTQPAQHLADMSMADREAKVKELGLPAFRARQLSTHRSEERRVGKENEVYQNVNE